MGSYVLPIRRTSEKASQTQEDQEGAAVVAFPVLCHAGSTEAHKCLIGDPGKWETEEPRKLMQVMPYMYVYFHSSEAARSAASHALVCGTGVQHVKRIIIYNICITPYNTIL